ncbi:MAG: antibiotic biosynthesis monooxygenase [Pseudomonadota bacterium]
MIAVIFEVTPAPGRRDEYLDVAASLRDAVESIDGFLSIERFASLTNEGKMLSLSYWRDEAALEAWRQIESHRKAQAQGRASLFSDYRLRIARIDRDYGMFDRDQAPRDSREIHG